MSPGHHAPSGAQGAASSYLETRLRTASPVELTLVVYDVLVFSLERAIQATRAGQVELRVQSTNRALAALAELRCSLDLDRGGEVARSLDRLYAYGLGELSGALREPSTACLEAQLRVFRPLREAWAQVAQGACSQPHPHAAAAPAPTAGPVLAGVTA